jgi:photosystem II stability/assembly factor-like uncharacterized protein
MKTSISLAIFTLFVQVTFAQSWSLLNSSSPANSTFKGISAATGSYVVAVGGTATNTRLFAYTSDGGSSWTHPTTVWTQANRPLNDILVTPSNFVHHALLPSTYTQATNIESGGGGNDGFAGAYNLSTGSIMNKMSINGAVKILVGKDQDGFPVIVATQASNGQWGYTTSGASSGTSTWNNVFNIGNDSWVIGENGKLNKNNDGLISYTWTDINTNVTDNLNGIYFINNNTGFIVGANGVVLKTVDGGLSWSASYPTTHNLHAVTFVNTTEGWAVGENGTILHTTNAGTNWTVFTSPTTNTLFDVSFVNPFVGYAAGANGTIIKFQANCANASSYTAISCGTYNWGPQQYTTSGTYTQNFSNQYGCDSTVTLNLTVHPEMPVTDIYPSACESYTFNGTVYTQSGMYLDTLTSVVYGCDSLVRLNLNIASSISATVSVFGNSLAAFDQNGGFYNHQWVDCSTNFSQISGAINQSFTPTQNGSYAVILSSGGICPADTSACVQFCAGINNTVSQNGNTLTATQSGANYQWINCANNTPISGANSQTFTAITNGSYAVVITSVACSDTSECTTFSTIGLNENELATFLLYPNPATDFVTISNIEAGSTISLVDLTGKTVSQVIAGSTAVNVETSNFTPGVYFVTVSGLNGTQKLIIE